MAPPVLRSLPRNFPAFLAATLKGIDDEFPLLTLKLPDEHRGEAAYHNGQQFFILRVAARVLPGFNGGLVEFVFQHPTSPQKC